MSARHLPRVMSHRGKSSHDVERENFEKVQTVAINKAINNQETPVKEKHMRSTILGTFRDNGCSLFWAVVIKLPLQGNAIICWKFCHVLHKILREGHASSIPDSVRYNSHIIELGKLWGHLKEGYGRLIASYTKLLIQKIKFHRKNQQIPGHLKMEDDQFARICGLDVNNYFEISVDMLDYLDEILNVQQSVFDSLDRSRANSMTNSGQCRLAPLILCILDSCQLYDYLVKSLFKLHSSLPPDTLSGHRDRFLAAYKRLKQFYYSSSNLQYFKNLVQVPLLPDEPPNFLIASDFSKHVKPVAVIPAEPEELEVEETVGVLIDTSPTPDDQFEGGFGDGPQFNGGPPEIDERDLLIERLSREIQQLKMEIQRIKTEDQKIISSLKEEILQLEKILAELRSAAAESLKDNENLKNEVLVLQASADAADKLNEVEKHAKTNEERFKKMKDIYQRLKEEHVSLLRTNAEVTKQLGNEKKVREEKEQIIKEKELEVGRLEEEKQVVQETLRKSADDVTEELVGAKSQILSLENQKEDLESKVKDLEDVRDDMVNKLQSCEELIASVESELRQSQDERKEAEDKFSENTTNLQAELNGLKEDKQRIEEQLNQKISELQGTVTQLETDKQLMEDELTRKFFDLQQELEELLEEKQKTEKKMGDEKEELHRRLIDGAIEEGRSIISDAHSQFENPSHLSVTCTAEFLLMRAEPVVACLGKLQQCHDMYSADTKDLESYIQSITSYAHHMGDCIIHGIATSHSAQIEPAEELSNACRDAAEKGLLTLDAIQTGEDIPSKVDSTTQSVQHIIKLAEALVPKMEDVKLEEIGDMLEGEMQSITGAIEQAASKMEEMLNKTRENNTGIELEVNQRILDTCTALMQAIKVLVEKSRDLQKEIVLQGRGTSTAKEFYKKHHRWTEGLMSAAKAVGWGATTLLESADKVVRGEGKFEELIVCSQEIAASTVQLVVASKVKADRGSKALSELSTASKGVSQATGNVVASAKTGAAIVEDKNLMDFTKLTLHQTKKCEMQSQVRLLELESLLEKERVNLSDLRKQHYQLAGESEGWELDQEGELLAEENVKKS
ncbi:hypothetical protein ScPMuIL_005661 [Solemya velum]